MNPKVTIIVPVFNTVKYLEECLKSLEIINFKSLEVIIIDNYSTDGSYEILKKIKKKNYKIIRNTKNLGQSYSLNKGIKMSKSKFVAIMDSDDICLPNRIEESYNFLKKNHAYALVAGMSDTIDKNGNKIKNRRFTLDTNLIKSRILIDNPISHTTVMFRKYFLEKVGGYSKYLKFTQDYELFSKIINKGYKIKILEKKFTKVRKHKSQQSSKNNYSQLLESTRISLQNIEGKIKLDKKIISLIKFIILKKDKVFENLKYLEKINILENFLQQVFVDDRTRLYFCSLIFSRYNKFEKMLIVKFLFNYLMKNNFLFYNRETFLRVIKSLLNILF